LAESGFELSTDKIKVEVENQYSKGKEYQTNEQLLPVGFLFTVLGKQFVVDLVRKASPWEFRKNV
jgi:hypothetical protein